MPLAHRLKQGIEVEVSRRKPPSIVEACGSEPATARIRVLEQTGTRRDYCNLMEHHGTIGHPACWSTMGQGRCGIVDGGERISPATQDWGIVAGQSTVQGAEGCVFDRIRLLSP